MIQRLLEKWELHSLAEVAEEWKWLRGYIRRYKGVIALYFLLGLASVVLTLGGSVLSKYLIDVVTGYHKSSILPIAAAYVIFGLVSILSSSVSSRISTKYSTKVTNEMQYEMFRETLNVEWNYIKKYHTGDLINRINGDVSTVSNSILTWLPNFIIKFIQALCCIGIILYYDPVMALISIISTPVMVLFSRTLMSKMRLFSKRSREASSKIYAFIQESYSNMQSIKAFGIVEDFNLKFKMIQNDYYAVVMEQNKFAVLTKVLMSLIGMIVSYSCYGWGVYRLWSGVITFGTMQMFLQLASYLSNAFSSMVSMVPTAIGTLTAARRLIDVVTLQKEETDAAVDVEAIKTAAAEGVGVHIEQARFAYEEPEEVFSCFSFDAAPGEVVALVGPSGSGKTTLFRILLGIVSISSGKSEIFYPMADGVVRHRISPSTRGLFAYVPQGNSIFYGTIAEHMRLFRMDATEEEIVEALKTACAWEFVSQLDDGIHTVIEEDGNNFSEGQKQRLCIARALISTAPIVLLDEGTSALDSETERALLRNLATSRAKKTFIVSTHRTSVLDICDRTYSIEDKMLRRI